MVLALLRLGLRFSQSLFGNVQCSVFRAIVHGCHAVRIGHVNRAWCCIDQERHNLFRSLILRCIMEWYILSLVVRSTGLWIRLDQCPHGTHVTHV